MAQFNQPQKWSNSSMHLPVSLQYFERGGLMTHVSEQSFGAFSKLPSSKPFITSSMALSCCRGWMMPGSRVETKTKRNNERGTPISKKSEQNGRWVQLMLLMSIKYSKTVMDTHASQNIAGPNFIIFSKSFFEEAEALLIVVPFSMSPTSFASLSSPLCSSQSGLMPRSLKICFRDLSTAERPCMSPARSTKVFPLSSLTYGLTLWSNKYSMMSLLKVEDTDRWSAVLPSLSLMPTKSALKYSKILRPAMSPT
mmetsp:Transcript_150828/g.484727  ORF Transcript_150828/g.484727 Transcript_150828/m.484727 type:complete len:253 (+) Transcript_150828:488-1246(+)